MDLIISHGHCPDGFCAALIAQKRYPEAEVMFRDHGLEPPYEEVTGKDVLVTDFSWRTREQNDRLAALAKSFRILDHHKTAEATLIGAPYATFDMKRSGAGLAWDYLFGEHSDLCRNGTNEGSLLDYKPEYAHDESVFAIQRPWWVNYVEDRDLWNWKLPNSKAVCAFLGTLEFTKAAWSVLDKMTPEEALVLGNGALAHIEHYTREAVKQAQTGLLLSRKTAVLNVPYLNCSEVGNALAQTHNISLTWFERQDGMIQFSLRSIGDSDVSLVAKQFGGGGHQHAAGFQMTLADGRNLIDNILNRASFREQLENVITRFRSPGGCV